MVFESGPPTFPLLFTIDGSARHEILLVSSSTSLSDLTSQIVKTVSSSPNTEEFMSKYSKKGEQKVTEMKVRWSSQGRDTKIFPASTIVTQENCEAVLRMIEAGGVGRDVLDVKVQTEAQEGEGQQQQ